MARGAERVAADGHGCAWRPVSRVARLAWTAVGGAALGIAVALTAVGVAASPRTAAAAEIHRCPQADGTIRYQDRPCGAAPARPSAAADPEGSAAPSRAPPSGGVPSSATPSRAAPSLPDASPPVTLPAGAPSGSRADYIALNSTRCREGNRRACAAVTCERSGRLDSPACQEAVGYLRGPGWELRPRSDLFDPARATDEFTLACRGGARRAILQRARGSDLYAWPALGAAPARTVARAALPDAAREFCAVP
jgi:hypothetical protein